MASTRLEEELECPVCFERFNIPKVLPCQHTFCANCIQQLVDRGNVTCPECRGVHHVPPNGFPTNITIQRLLSASETSNAQTTHTQHDTGMHSRVQPTAPPMPSSYSGQTTEYHLPILPIPQVPAHNNHSQRNEQHSGLSSAAYGFRSEQTRAHPPHSRELSRINERNERENPQTVSGSLGRRNATDDGSDWTQCKATFLKYFKIVRKGIRKVISSFLRRYKECMTFTISVFLLVTFMRFIAGAVKLSSDCKKEKHVAEYLFVKSLFGFLFWGVMLLLRCKKKLVNAMDNLFIEVYVVVVEGLFSFIWLIVGTAWTIGYRDDMIDTCPFHVKDWNKHFITFAMVLVIWDWIAIVLFLFYCGFIQFDRTEGEEDNRVEPVD